jgi:DNA polymerase III epsilon subunit-like protein
MSRVYVSLDLEATGMQPERDEIIEIGAVKFRDGQVLGRWESLVRARQPLPYKITQLTGIRTSDVQRAPHMTEIAAQLSRFVGDSPIIGQSIWLDMAMLEHAGVRMRNILWDTFELATLLVPEASVYNLRSVAGSLGVDVGDGNHRALADAELTMRVFLALRERIEDLPLEVLSEIGRATARSENWPLRHLFSEIEHEKARNAFSATAGSSIRAQLMSKGRTDAELDVGLMRAPGGYAPEAPPATGYEGEWAIQKGEIRAVLEPGGPMSEEFGGYEHRPQQIEMAEAVADAFNKGHHLVVEAGTGTGPSTCRTSYSARTCRCSSGCSGVVDRGPGIGNERPITHSPQMAAPLTHHPTRPPSTDHWPPRSPSAPPSSKARRTTSACAAGTSSGEPRRGASSSCA